MTKRTVLIGFAVVAVVVVTIGVIAFYTPRPHVPFAPLVDKSLIDPDNPAKVFRIDMARVEREYPLSRAHLEALTAANLRTLEQEEVDQIYGRLTAGPIPDGPYYGDLFFARGEDGLTPRLEEILGGVKGRIAGKKIEILEHVGRTLWKGKMFYRDERVLRNFIDDFQPLRALIDDPEALMKTNVPREGWLRFILPTTDVWLMFPAKLHCGQSLLDGRRESIIIDYAYGDELPGYQKNPDELVGRNGLEIRDEIRMVRPGFYLGRAYINKIFVINFTLLIAEGAEAEPEDCWIGEQARAASAPQ